MNNNSSNNLNSDFDRERPFRPPETLRWLALTSGAEACEVLVYAEAALNRSSRVSSAILQKSIGAGRTQGIISAATKLANSYLKMAQSENDLLYEKAPESIEVATKRIQLNNDRRLDPLREKLSLTSGAIARARALAAARESYLFIESIEGSGGNGSIGLALSNVLDHKYQDSIQQLKNIYERSRTLSYRQFAIAIMTTCLVSTHEYDRVINDFPLDVIEGDSHIEIALGINKLVACAISQRDDDGVQLLVDYLSSSPMDKDINDFVVQRLRSLLVYTTNEDAPHLAICSILEDGIERLSRRSS